MMVALAAVATVLVFALCLHANRSRLDDRRGPLQLRDDWWPEFEHQFRDHVARIERRRRRRAGGPMRALLLIAGSPLALGRALAGAVSRAAGITAAARASFGRRWWRPGALAGQRSAPLPRRRAG